MPFTQIEGVERQPERPEDVLPGGKAARMRVRTVERSYDFVFHHGLDDWIDAVTERRGIWENRTRMADDD